VPKLNQILAIESGVKTRVYAKLSEDHKILQKPELFSGHVRRYTPRDDDPSSPAGEKLPDETRKVQFRVLDVLKATAEGMTEHLDVAATRDWTNMNARADVIINGQPLLQNVPVTYLLMLEKQLSDLHTFVKKLPTLDPGEQWTYDRNQDVFSTVPAGTARTKKVTRPMVLYDATKEHPAQVKEATEDVFCGTWNTVKFSSALPTGTVNDMLRRVEELQKAVKFAREQANSVDATPMSVGNQIFDFLFAPALKPAT
jgi:hypothetical protein